MVASRAKPIVVGGDEQNRRSRREIIMRICTIIISVLAVSVLFVALLGCAKKENRSREESGTDLEPDSQSAANDSQIIKSREITSQASTADIPARPEDEVAEEGEGGLARHVDEVRRTFLSLQQVCEANDVDGYLAFWDDETKMAVDGRDLDVDERRERRRQSLTKKPGMLEKIANAKMESIAVDTSQAEKIERTFGVEVKGTMMLVRTSGDAFLFHETADGWKLFTIASPGYFP
jgi:hypothetical protein